MSTRVSRLRSSLPALGIVAAVALGVIGGLETLARRLESSGQVYPYKWEDWLRYLVPTLWPSGGTPGLLLTGPSTARESFLVEEVSRAFPRHRVIPGALSLGTLRDVTASLEFIEAEYGAGALPSVVVLGISRRFLAELPSDRPFQPALARYGRRYGPLSHPEAAFGLARKPVLSGTIDYLRFRATRQSPRYRAVLAWLTTRVISAEMSSWLTESPVARSLSKSGLGQLMGLQPLASLGPREVARQYLLPYRYQPVHVGWRPEAREALLDDPNTAWPALFQWNPDSDAVSIRARTDALIEYTNRRGMELYVVNLPEPSSLRARTPPDLAIRYTALLQALYDTVPYLDLRCLIPDTDFLDADHVLWNGAKNVSAHVIGFMNAVRAERARSGGDRETLKALADQWSRGSCALDP